MRTAWYQNWEPSRRPFQLQLPVLSYESHFEVWQQKLKTILRRAAVEGFLESPLPLDDLDTNSDEWAAATYCSALLESSISDDVLADLLTLSADGELSQDPYAILCQVRRLVKAVQTVKENSSSAARINLRNVFQGRIHYENADELREDVTAMDYNDNDLYSFILVAALLIKIDFPAYQPDRLQEHVSSVLQPTGESLYVEAFLLLVFMKRPRDRDLEDRQSMRVLQRCTPV
ncbi:hypothetical protein VPNG_06265 [Cytospora leucostoma]|uniref:Uncharacterized protein n=1 Tax=Cytospora leucostoma TaxID=1230097 RepID=A0A423X2B0_9PEZI|nr:hypothetical protein VPNG_06265 [Cytospora leucostoma]